MPTIIFDASVTRDNNGLAEVLITRNEQYVQATVLFEEIDTVEKFVAWALAQRGKQQQVDPALQRRFTVTFHTEPDGEVEVIVVDDIQHTPLPTDAALAALPTPEQVAQMTTAGELRNVLVEVVRWLKG